MLNGMVRRAVVVGVLPLLLAGCSRTLEEQAHDGLQDDLDAVHGEFLDRRARHLDVEGAALLEAVDRYHDAIESSVDDDGVSLVWEIVSSASETEGWIWPETTTVSEGACVLVLIRYGDGGDDRGTVRTEPVPCPEGSEILSDEGYPVDALTTDLDGRMDDVPEKPYDPPVCYSGGDCSGGGG
jgi:hypothetical protein